MKRILIVGSDGYIGSRLCEYLKKFQGYKVDTLDTGYFRDGVIKKLKKVTYDTDIRKFKLNILKKYNVCIFLAGQQNDPGNFSKKKFYSITKLYTLNVAKYCKKNNVKFIFPSSCSVYGYSNYFVCEKSKVNPLTYYSKNKIEIENGLKKITSKKFRPIILRFSTIFGYSNALRADLLINMLCLMSVSQKKIVLNSNGKSWRPHLNLDYACKAIKMCIDKDFQYNDPQIFNVGFNDYNLRTLDVAKIIKKITKVQIKYNFKNLNSNIKADKIVKNGVDKRSYRVKFDLFNKYFPNFRQNNNIVKDITILIKRISNLKKINKFILKDYKFFRLQKMEKLISQKYLDKDLFWSEK